MDSVCLAIELAVVLTASDVRMRKNYVTKGIPKTSYFDSLLIHHGLDSLQVIGFSRPSNNEVKVYLLCSN